jgi:multiple sugar transport system substrate-binding protein
MGLKAIARNTLIITIIILVIIAGIAVYYAWQSGGGGTSGSNKVKLSVMVPQGDPTLQPFIKTVAKDFMAKHPNVEITLQPVPFSQMVTTALTALKNKNPSPSIIIFYPSQASSLGPWMLDLKKYFDNGLFNKSDIPESSMLPVYLLDKNGNVQKIFGVPFQQVFGYVLVYRKSIFNNKTLQAEFQQEYGFPFNPKEWSSWDQLVAAASFIQSKHLTKWALLFPNGLEHSIFNTYTGIFYTYALNMSDSCPDIPVKNGKIPTHGYWLYVKEENGKIVPTFECPSAIAALKEYKKLIQFEPPIDQQAMEYDQIRDLFKTGDYAMVAAWTSFIPVYNGTGSKVAGDIDVAPLPGGKNPWGTSQAPTFIGINPYAPDVEMAAKFIAFLLQPSEMKKGAEQVGFVPATFSGLKEASKITKTAWVKLFIPLLEKSAITDIQRLTLQNKIINFFNDLKPIFINEVAKYFRGQQTAEQAMHTITVQWEKIMKVSP